jgi:tetratricopeptide (TPR) repeat protein
MSSSIRGWGVLVGLIGFVLGTGAGGSLALAADTPRELVQALEARVREAPADPDAHFELAMALARTVKLEAGYRELTRVQELAPDYADRLFARLKPAADRDPDSQDALFRLAFASYFKALEARRSADALPPEQAEESSRRRDSAAFLTREATRYFERMANQDPLDLWPLLYLGYLRLEAGDPEAALTLWRKALAMQDHAVPHFLIGQLHLRRGQMIEGFRELSTAMQLRGLDP